MEMTEAKYEILDMYGTVLATGMTYENALAFIDGFKVRFFNEFLYLTIREIPKCSDYGPEEWEHKNDC